MYTTCSEASAFEKTFAHVFDDSAAFHLVRVTSYYVVPSQWFDPIECPASVPLNASTRARLL